jgi:DedD protein
LSALSDLVAKRPTPPPPPEVKAAPPPLASQRALASRYFTVQVGSFQDPANAASLVRELSAKGWEAFAADWTNSAGKTWKVVRVGRYQTEKEATEASAELRSAANLRGNVLNIR